MALPVINSPASTNERLSNRERFLQIPGVEKKLNSMATKFGVEKEELLFLIEQETGGSYSSAQQNFQGGAARGLIQFLGDKKFIYSFIFY